MRYKNSSKIKKPWLVGLLDIILPGLGFIYLRGIGSVIAGVILMIITYYMNASPVFWILFGAGIRNISTWIFWAIIICAVSVNIARWKNRKIIGETGTGNIPTKSTAESVTICSSCGAEIQPRYVFCAKCGEPVNTLSS